MIHILYFSDGFRLYVCEKSARDTTARQCGESESHLGEGVKCYHIGIYDSETGEKVVLSYITLNYRGLY